jgi:hypothetical protein
VEKVDSMQESLFESFERSLRESVEFYKHRDGGVEREGDGFIIGPY